MSFICQSCSTEQGTWTGSCPNCGSKRALQIGAEETMVGKTIAGKYKILRKLGQGGVGSVFEGELEGIGQRVALKFLNPSFQMDSKTALRFLNEAKGLARLSHPNTVSLHDFGQDEEGRFFISMEYVEGDDLRKFMEGGRLSPADAIEVTLQVADALGDAHSKGLIHRDVKPENIMVRRRARGVFVKVLDFGLARLMEEGTSRLTNAGTLMGSLRYISPEQASGTDVDGRTDIYSLGIVLFEALTGAQPFSAAVEVDLLRMHKETPTPHLWESARDLALPQLDAVIQKATQKQRDARYASMEEFSAALNAALAGLPDPKDLKQIAQSRGAATMKLPVATDDMIRPPAPGLQHVRTQISTAPRTAQESAVREKSVPSVGQAPAVSQAAASAPNTPAARNKSVGVKPSGQPSWVSSHRTWLMAGGAVVVLAAAAFLMLRPAPTSVTSPAPRASADAPVAPAPAVAAPPVEPPKPVEPPPPVEAPAAAAPEPVPAPEPSAAPTPSAPPAAPSHEVANAPHPSRKSETTQHTNPSSKPKKPVTHSKDHIVDPFE